MPMKNKNNSIHIIMFMECGEILSDREFLGFSVLLEPSKILNSIELEVYIY